MNREHGRSCAKQIRDQAAAENWSQEATVDQIVACCGVSRLRAHRMAHGWTLKEAVARYRILAEQVEGAAKLDGDQLGIWETTDRCPRSRTIDLLCKLYATNAAGLGFAGDYQAATPVSVAAAVPDLSGSVALTPPATLGAAHAAPRGLAQLLESTRRSVDRTLAQGTVTSSQLDLLEERLSWLSHQYIRTPPSPMLGMLLAEMEEIQGLAINRQPAALQTRLSEMTALVATLVADALMKLGILQQSQAWYATARTAADDSGNVELRARVRVQAAMLPYYYGPLSAAAALAHEARMLSRNRTTATSAFAAAAEARALARQGHAEAAINAVQIARNNFERSQPGAADDAFAFPERRLLLYLSGIFTALGRISEARSVRQQALALYPEESGIDPALLRLEEAICLVRERNLNEACQLAAATFLEVPEQHRTPILGARAQHVIAAVPPVMRASRPVRQLGEALELPTSVR